MIKRLGEKPFHQWELNRQISVQDVDYDEIHWWNKNMEKALVTEPSPSIIVPNILLQEAENIYIDLVLNDNIVEHTSFGVCPRPRPEDYVYTEIEIRRWEDLAKKIDKIYSMDWQNGKDGFSPLVNVSDIDGGHRVTITDVEGEKAFDVMDGKGGEGGTGGGSVQPNWSQNDETQPDYVKNRTHWEETFAPIEWDGNTEGRDSFDASALGFGTFYKISDEVWTEERLKRSTVNIENMIIADGVFEYEYSLVRDEYLGVLSEYHLFDSVQKAYILSAFHAADLTETYGFSISSPGLYIGYFNEVGDFAFLTVTTPSIYHKISDEFLPDDVFRGSLMANAPLVHHDTFNYIDLTVDGDVYHGYNMIGEVEDTDARIEDALRTGMARTRLKLHTADSADEVSCTFILSYVEEYPDRYSGSCVVNFGNERILVTLELGKAGVGDCSENIFRLRAETLVAKNDVQTMIDEAIAKALGGN